MEFAPKIQTNVVLADNILVRIRLPNVCPTGFFACFFVRRMRSDISLEGRGSHKTAQGNALGTGSTIPVF